MALTSTFLGAMIGNEMLSKTVSNSASSIYSGLSSLNENPKFDFKELLEELDIETKLTVIIKFLDDLKETHLTESNKLSLNSIYDIIHKIECEIKDINNEIDNHNKKWFHQIRYFNYHKQLDNLKKHVKILDSRFDLFMKIIF